MPGGKATFDNLYYQSNWYLGLKQVLFVIWVKHTTGPVRTFVLDCSRIQAGCLTHPAPGISSDTVFPSSVTVKCFRQHHSPNTRRSKLTQQADTRPIKVYKFQFRWARRYVLYSLSQQTFYKTDQVVVTRTGATATGKVRRD